MLVLVSLAQYQSIAVICIVYPGQYLGNDVLVTPLLSYVILQGSANVPGLC